MTITRLEDGTWLGIPSDEMTPSERRRKYLYDQARRAEEIAQQPLVAHQPIIAGLTHPREPTAAEIAGDARAPEHELCAVCERRPAVAQGEDGRRICRAPPCVKRTRRARR